MYEESTSDKIAKLQSEIIAQQVDVITKSDRKNAVASLLASIKVFADHIILTDDKSMATMEVVDLAIEQIKSIASEQKDRS